MSCQRINNYENKNILKLIRDKINLIFTVWDEIIEIEILLKQRLSTINRDYWESEIALEKKRKKLIVIGCYLPKETKK